MKVRRFVFVIFLVALGTTAYAVEPIHVNFGAKRESEELMLQKLEEFFARRAKMVDRGVSDASEFNSVFSGFQEAKLSASTYGRLVEIYFTAEENHDVKYIPAIDRLLTERAREGSLPVSALESILRKTPDGRLAEIVTTAIEHQPVLKTLALQQTIHEEFSRIINQAQYAYEVHGSILQLADPEKVKATPEVAAKLKAFVASKDDLAYSRMIEANPRLLSAVASDLPVHSLQDMQAFIAMKLAHVSPIGAGRSTEIPDATKDSFAHGAQEIRHAMVDVSRDRIRFLMNREVNRVSAGLSEKELINALDLLSDLDGTPYLADMQKLATTAGHGDRVRQMAMSALGKTVATHPEVRKSVFEAATMLDRVRPEILSNLSFMTGLHPLSTEESEILRKIIARNDLPSDGPSQAALVKLRRGTLQMIPSSCPAAFSGLQPKL